MMRRLIFASLLAAAAPLTLATPAVAQSRQDEARFDAAQQRYDRELAVYQDALRRYRATRGGYGYGQPGGGYPPPGAYPPAGAYRGGYDDDRDEGGYDPAQDYRGGPSYRERTLAADDRVYRGSDGRYYCKRNDGTTGLIIGAAGGGILGNVIDGGHSRAAGTLIGGALGAIAGKAIDQNNTDIRCR